MVLVDGKARAFKADLTCDKNVAFQGDGWEEGF